MFLGRGTAIFYISALGAAPPGLVEHIADWDA